MICSPFFFFCIIHVWAGESNVFSEVKSIRDHWFDLDPVCKCVPQEEQVVLIFLNSQWEFCQFSPRRLRYHVNAFLPPGRWSCPTVKQLIWNPNWRCLCYSRAWYIPFRACQNLRIRLVKMMADRKRNDLQLVLSFTSLVPAIYTGDFSSFFSDYSIDCPLGYFML